MVEWDMMPTDWSTLETDMVQKLKTRLYGNPRYVETIDNSNKKSQETTEYPIAPSVVLKFHDYAEGEEEEIRNAESLNYNEIVSITTEINEMGEMVQTRLIRCYNKIIIRIN